MALMGACSNTTTATPVVACGPDDVAVTNLDLVLVTDYEAGLYYAVVDPVPAILFDPPSAGLLDAATAAASNAAASAVAAAVGKYFPNGCASASASGNVVTFKLDACNGPLDLARVTGTVTAVLEVRGNTVAVELAGNKISANGATIFLTTSATLTGSNGQRTLVVNSQTTGTGPNGSNAAHTGMYMVAWATGSGCATIDGTLGGGGSGGNVTSTQITSFVSCAGKCPQSGSAVSSVSGDGTVAIAFDGSSSARCTASNGTSAVIPLQCLR
jgi:hypothetical protein